MLLERFAVTKRDAVDLAPRCNVCPGEDVAAVIEHEGGRPIRSLRTGFPLRAIPGDATEGYPVSSLVNAGRNDSPDCVRPIGGRLRLVPPQALG